MITEHNLNLLKRLARLLFQLRCLPLRFNRSQEKFIYDPSRFKFSVIFVLLSVLHFLLAVVNLFHLCSKKTLISEQKAKNCSSLGLSVSLFNVLFMSLFLLCFFALLKDPFLTAATNNCFLLFLKDLQNVLDLEKFQRSKFYLAMDKFTTGMVFGVQGLGALIAGQCWIFPKFGLFFTSFIPGDWNPLWRLPVQLGYTYFVLASFLTINFLLVFILSEMPMFLTLISTECKPGLETGAYFTSREVRRVENLPGFYRRVEHLLKISLDAFAVIIIPGETFLTVTVVGSSCCMILYWKTFDYVQLFTIMNAHVSCLATIIIVFEIGGRFDLYSRRTLQAWKRFSWGSPEDSKYMKKYQRSLRPLLYNYKEYRKIKRGTLFAILKSIAVNTFRVIATMKKYLSMK